MTSCLSRYAVLPPMFGMTIQQSIALGIAILAGACAPRSEPAAVPKEAPVAPAAAAVSPEDPNSPLVAIADRQGVCNVTDRYMGTPQIPVTVDGRVYYGCCEMCKGRLQSEANTRTAVDPISGKSVDKALATLGRERNGSVVYFDNQSNFEAYRRKLASRTAGE